MTRTARGRALLRSRIAAAIEADPDRTNGNISVELRCSAHTVRSVRESLAAVDDPSERREHAGSSNLVAPGAGNDRAAKHGAYREVGLAPVREAKLAYLRALYPHAPGELLLLQAHRAAQLELIWEWQESHGVIRDKRAGTVYPAALFGAKLASAYENALGRLAELERANSATDPEAALAAVVAELAAARENGGSGDD